LGQSLNFLLEVDQVFAEHSFQRISESLESLPFFNVEFEVFVEFEAAEIELIFVKLNDFLHIEKSEFELSGSLCHVNNLIPAVVDVARFKECEQLSEVRMRLVAPNELVKKTAEDPGIAF
jgi:hypothetical protein